MERALHYTHYTHYTYYTHTSRFAHDRSRVSPHSTLNPTLGASEELQEEDLWDKLGLIWLEIIATCMSF